MKDLMVDIETLGNGPTSVLTQIGACFFDRYTGEIGEKFCQNISVQNCLDMGLQLDWDTIKWWFEQTEEKTWMKEPQPLGKVLGQFSAFAKPAEAVWSHATFDMPIIANAYRRIKQGLPFHYRAMRDIRTLTDLAKVSKEEIAATPANGKTHNGLDDCVFQVAYCVKCFNKLKGQPNG
jgi:hypothetical protein